jgi:hypothetical protein
VGRGGVRCPGRHAGRRQLMEWSGRAPAHRRVTLGWGECQTEHRHVQQIPGYINATSGVLQIAADLSNRPTRQPWAKCGLMHRRKDRCSFDHILGPAVTVGSPVYFGNMVGEVKTFFDNWLLNPDRHMVNTDHCARRTPACFARKSSMLRPPARLGNFHWPPITAYP